MKPERPTMKPPIVEETPDDATRREEDAQRQRGRERMLELWRGAVRAVTTAAPAPRCPACGEELGAGAVIELRGATVMICAGCTAAVERKRAKGGGP